MKTRRRAVALALCAAGCGSDHAVPTTVSGAVQAHSSSLAVDATGSRLWVVHPDADSVSVLDASTRRILRERHFAEPALDDTGRYDPAVMPRALALDRAETTLYVTGQRSGHVYALDAASLVVKADAAVCSEPIGVLVDRDDAHVFVACSADDRVVELDAGDLSRIAEAPCPRKPWSLSWAAGGRSLLSTHLLGPGVSRFTTDPLTLAETFALPDGPPEPAPDAPNAGDAPEEPHGVVRGIYDAVVRPGTDELWVAHLMLGIDTPQPRLDFQSTVFPSLSVLDGTGHEETRLTVQAHPGDGGAFGDTVSGPRAIAFSGDGALAFVVDANSEDVLVLDAERRIETTLVRPLPGHMPEGIVWSGGKIFVQERNTEDIAAFRVEDSDAGPAVVADGDAFPSLHRDPMPETLRLGQKLFNSADSDDVPITQNHWVACASCHLEGRSDAVTWLFAQGPRDTPTNAGGLRDTGFLFRTADRTKVEDYFETINVEQGGHFDIAEPSQKPLLEALAAYVNDAIAAPVPPSIDATHTLQGQALADLRARGETVFETAGCPACHSGPAKTDSGAMNPELDLGGPVVSAPTRGAVLLHDVGTCVTDGSYVDVAHDDIAGHPRDACAFDTPQLRGLADTAPYLHDGSAATLDDVVAVMLRAAAPPGKPTPELSDADEAALVEYLRGL